MPYFDKNITEVNATLGWEREYFHVDKALYAARPDLAMTGRPFGAAPAKGSSWTTTTSEPSQSACLRS